MTPLDRSRAALPANIRKTLEESNLPIEVATAIADLCEMRPEEALRKDAERYRWLRDRHDKGDEQAFVYGARGKLDEYIDAAMASEREPKERGE